MLFPLVTYPRRRCRRGERPRDCGITSGTQVFLWSRRKLPVSSDVIGERDTVSSGRGRQLLARAGETKRVTGRAALLLGLALVAPPGTSRAEAPPQGTPFGQV